MRIAFFTDTYYPEINGVANTLSRLHQYLDKNGIEHVFFAPQYDEEIMEDTILRFKGIQIPFSPNSRLALPYHSIVKKKIEEFKPDIIHIVTEFTIGTVGLHIARELSIPIVMSYHTNIDQYLEFFHARMFEAPVKAYFKWFHSHALLNLCPSMQTLNQLKEQDYENLDIWSRGVDTKLYSPQKRNGRFRSLYGEDKFLCLYVGRLSYEKGLDVYIEAIRKVNEKYEDRMMFLFAGDGPFRAELEKCQISNVRLTGFLRGEMLAELYADSDLFIFPSGTETFGNVLLEAMASGCACICTDSGGVTDFSVNGKNACVVGYRDNNALFEAIIGLYENPIMRERIALGALNTARLRSWDSVMDYLTDAYENVLEGEERKQA